MPHERSRAGAARVRRRSIEDRLQRMGVSNLDIVIVHDLSPDFAWFPNGWEAPFDIARTDAFSALSRLREEGIIRGWARASTRRWRSSRSSRTPTHAARARQGCVSLSFHDYLKTWPAAPSQAQ